MWRHFWSPYSKLLLTAGCKITPEKLLLQPFVCQTAWACTQHRPLMFLFAHIHTHSSRFLFKLNLFSSGSVLSAVWGPALARAVWEPETLVTSRPATIYPGSELVWKYFTWERKQGYKRAACRPQDAPSYSTGGEEQYCRGLAWRGPAARIQEKTVCVFLCVSVWAHAAWCWLKLGERERRGTFRKHQAAVTQTDGTERTE